MVTGFGRGRWWALGLLFAVFGEPVAEYGGEPGGLLDVGQVPAVGKHREPPLR